MITPPEPMIGSAKNAATLSAPSERILSSNSATRKSRNSASSMSSGARYGLGLETWWIRSWW
ncbi:hypothetical protein D3C80_2124370 [compost metagenome]